MCHCAAHAGSSGTCEGDFGRAANASMGNNRGTMQLRSCKREACTWELLQVRDGGLRDLRDLDEGMQRMSVLALADDGSRSVLQGEDCDSPTLEELARCTCISVSLAFRN